MHCTSLLTCCMRMEWKLWLKTPATSRSQTFINKGYIVQPISVDEHGIQPDKLKGKPSSPVYITPSHQFPLGGILPADRRAALIRFARENQSYIIEDDYDSEFRYYGDPVSPLYAMDSERVIYIGTFSKVLFPALRIGYAILPPKLQRRWRFPALIRMFRIRRLSKRHWLSFYILENLTDILGKCGDYMVSVGRCFYHHSKSVSGRPGTPGERRQDCILPLSFPEFILMSRSEKKPVNQNTHYACGVSQYSEGHACKQGAFGLRSSES